MTWALESRILHLTSDMVNSGQIVITTVVSHCLTFHDMQREQEYKQFIVTPGGVVTCCLI